MDRLLLNRGLIALGGLALVLSASGCRDRNLRVPPPAHYSDGGPAIPEAGGPAGYPSLTPDSSAVAPYPGVDYAPPGTFDAATTQTSGFLGGAGATQGLPGASDPSSYAGPYASPSSPAGLASTPYGPGAADDPYAGLNATAGSPASYPSGGALAPYGAGPAPATFPGLDAGSAVPPIPDTLPDMP